MMLFATSVNFNFKISPTCPFFSIPSTLTLTQIPSTSHFSRGTVCCWAPSSCLAPLCPSSALQLSGPFKNSNQGRCFCCLNPIWSCSLSSRPVLHCGDQRTPTTAASSHPSCTFPPRKLAQLISAFADTFGKQFGVTFQCFF